MQDGLPAVGELRAERREPRARGLGALVSPLSGEGQEEGCPVAAFARMGAASPPAFWRMRLRVRYSLPLASAPLRHLRVAREVSAELVAGPVEQAFRRLGAHVHL